jgi:transcriptional regulator with XRE-family HTH domain
LQGVTMFDWVGETLRRVRKERHMTLEQLGHQAGLGRGQLSRIENGHQEATLTTLAKILASQGVSRREFFRRYELVEAEAVAVARDGGRESLDSLASADAGAYPPPRSAASLPGEIREALGRVESFMRSTLEHAQPVAQGAVEMGDFVVVFRIVPRDAAGGELPEPPPPPAPPAGSGRKRSRRKLR